MADTNEKNSGPTDSILAQIVTLTPEEEAALDEMWERIWSENEAKEQAQQKQQGQQKEDDQA